MAGYARLPLLRPHIEKDELEQHFENAAGIKDPIRAYRRQHRPDGASNVITPRP